MDTFIKIIWNKLLYEYFLMFRLRMDGKQAFFFQIYT